MFPYFSKCFVLFKYLPNIYKDSFFRRFIKEVKMTEEEIENSTEEESVEADEEPVEADESDDDADEEKD